MLDLFTIFSKGGIVLWCFQGTCQSFTLPVNELIRSVILQVSFKSKFRLHIFRRMLLIQQLILPVVILIFVVLKKLSSFYYYTGAWGKQFVHSWLPYFKI